jgi:Holliday junction DNA helicase RuvA
MIGKLRGTVDGVGVESVVLDVGGVGYLVHCSPRTLSALPAQGEPASLLIDTHVREDMIRLYGFATEAEREWFRLMQGVQGVGARLALAILGVLSTSALAQAVAGGDRTAVARAPGVGPKLASRIVLELKDKGPGGAADAIVMPGQPPGAPLPQNVEDAVSALVNLGYGRPQAAAAVATAVAALGGEAQTAALIRGGLKALSM